MYLCTTYMQWQKRVPTPELELQEVREKNAGARLAFSFYAVLDPNPWNGAATCKLVLFISIFLI